MNNPQYRLSKNCQQGLDGMNLEYVLSIEGAKSLCMEKECICNDEGKVIAEISCVGGKLFAYVNAVHYAKPNNIKPLTITDTIELELIKSKVIAFMSDYLRRHLKERYSDEYISNLTVTRLECNLTLPCIKGATPSDVISLFENALDKTILHRQKKNKGGNSKINTSCYYTKPKEYCLKIYDKTIEQNNIGNYNIGQNMLRVEIVFLSKALKRMYGKKRTLDDVLTKRAIVILCKEYKQIYRQEVIEKYIKQYLDRCTDDIFVCLKSFENNEICETIAKYKEHIPDMEVLRKALKRWYRYKNVDDRSARIVAYYRKKRIGIPEGVLQTLKTFGENC